MNAIVNIEDPEETSRQIARHRDNNWVDFPLDLKAFAYAYLEHYNHRKAAESIGRAPSAGISLVRNPLISAYISHLLEKRNISNVITEDFIRSQYIQLLPKLMGEEPIPAVDKDGIEMQVKKFHSNELVSVLRELGKSTKFYENGSGGSGNVSVNLNFNSVMSEKPEVIIEHGD